MEDFQVVSRKKTKKTKNMENRLIVLRKTLSDIRFELMSQPFLSQALSSVKSCVETKLTTDGESASPTGEDRMPVHLVCYGLGNFVESYIARYQLAFLLALREELKVPDEHCEVYDPQFTEDEVNFLKQDSLTVIEHNQEGKHSCQSETKTVFFMPHCGRALYNNVLWANWGRGLRNLVVIGNSFSRMIESTPERVLKRNAGYIVKVKDFTNETPFPSLNDNEAIFNDTSVHSFLQNCNEQDVPTTLWEDNIEPVYDPSEEEIIFR